MLTLIGQQLLHVWKREGVKRKHFQIQSDTTNQLQRFCCFAQDILTYEKLRSSSEQMGSAFCFFTSVTTPANQLPVSGLLWNRTKSTKRAGHFRKRPLHPLLEQTVIFVSGMDWHVCMRSDELHENTQTQLNHQELGNK